jgi:chemotaxis protein MotB
VRRRRSSFEFNFWPGFTDVLAGMLLALVLVLTFFAVTQTGLVHLVGGKDAALRALEEQAAELRRLLALSEDRAEALSVDLIAATQAVELFGAERDAAVAVAQALRDEVADEQVRIADLARRLKDYVEQIKELNAKLADAEETAEARESSVAELQAAVNRLRSQLARMGADLGAARRKTNEQSLRLSQLLVEMAKKDERIVELERLERYRSEFLERMSEVFADNPNVRVVGDRFVFQSEVLFASGSAEIGEAGRRELDKFVRAFKALIPRIPEDLDVNVQVQGHTDTDALVSDEQFRDNWELSTARALRVVNVLAAAGVPDSMMSAAGFGEHFPRVQGSSPEAKAQNRRIEIRITRR